jgi:membrane protease YdiL (CAAX protease family)
VILVTTPLQALGEEYAFRGYLMQAFGSLTRSRVVAVLVTSGLFALAHGAQNAPLFIDRFVFGLMAGLVVILVGGLEAGIALHILNNLLAFALAIVFGDLQGALTVSEVSWWQVPVTVAQNGVYLVLVLLVARRMGLRNTTSPPVAEPTPQPVG